LFCENFESKLFPGLILRIKKATFLIFGSGKIVITGLNDHNLINNIFNDLYSILKKFKKQNLHAHKNLKVFLIK